MNIENPLNNNENGPVRSRRKMITAEILDIIRYQINIRKTNKELSENNLISLDCARKLANKISQGLSNEEIIHKKGRKKNLNVEINHQISAITQSDNALTQKGVAETLSLSGIVRSQSFISKSLKKMEITRKRLSLILIERNSPRVIDTRSSYCAELNEISLERLIFLDETGFNLHTANHYGYSPKNTKAFLAVKANRGINQSLMCAIDKNGIIAKDVRVVLIMEICSKISLSEIF